MGTRGKLHLTLSRRAQHRSSWVTRCQVAEALGAEVAHSHEALAEASAQREDGAIVNWS